MESTLGWFGGDWWTRSQRGQDIGSAPRLRSCCGIDGWGESGDGDIDWLLGGNGWNNLIAITSMDISWISGWLRYVVCRRGSGNENGWVERMVDRWVTAGKRSIGRLR